MKKIAIISGGRSCEREVSLATGEQIYRHCNPEKYDAFLFDFTKCGIVRQLNNKKNLLHKKYSWINFLKKIKTDGFDLVIIGLHGTDGEDGYIQGVLEEIGLAYVGSNSKSSELAMDKYRTALLFEEYGIRTPNKYLACKSVYDRSAQIILNKMGNDCVVKPNALGSSVGLYYVEKDMSILHKMKILEKAFSVSDEVLIEDYISGREFACGLLNYQDGRVEVLPVIEIITNQKIFDYDAKYKNKTLEICPAEVHPTISGSIQETTLRAHLLLGCSGLSRSDFIVDSKNHIYILETNTLPGMTETSLFPREFISTGRSFSELIEILIKKALSLR